MIADHRDGEGAELGGRGAIKRGGGPAQADGTLLGKILIAQAQDCFIRADVAADGPADKVKVVWRTAVS